MFVGVHVGMVGKCAVVQWILFEDRRRYPCLRERPAIASTIAPRRNHRHAQVVQRCDPALENRNEQAAAHADAANPPATGIDVEDSRQSRVLGLRHDRSGYLTNELGHSQLRRRVRTRYGGDVPLDVAERTERTLLLTSPQRDANSSFGFDLQRVQNPHRLHRDDDASTVIGRAGAGCPAVEVRPDQDQFILPLRVDTGNLAEDVVTFFPIAGEFRLDVQLEFYADV